MTTNALYAPENWTRATACHSRGRGEVNTLTEKLDEIVSELNGICRTSSLEFALRVGAVVIHHFYEGDTKAWRDRGPKLHSFRRLAEHPKLLIGPGALYRCVAVFELCDRLRAPSRWRRLGASHLRAVVGVPEDKQERLLTLANDQHWSVQQLEAKAQELKKSRSKGGRRLQSPLKKILRALDRHLRHHEDMLDQSRERDAVELEEQLELLLKLRGVIDHMASVVKARLDQLAS